MKLSSLILNLKLHHYYWDMLFSVDDIGWISRKKWCHSKAPMCLSNMILFLLKNNTIIIAQRTLHNIFLLHLHKINIILIHVSGGNFVQFT